MSPPLDLGVRIHALAVAIEGVLVAGASQEHHLRADHPPFWNDDGEPTPLDAALRHYGGQPGPLFDLWCMCRATEHLRRVWTGLERAPVAVPEVVPVPPIPPPAEPPP
jgi:hypothetical protein